MATGLLDLADVTDTVQGVTVRGVSARGIAYLFARFPEIRRFMTTRQFTVDELTLIGPEFVGAVIAVSCGYIPDATNDKINLQYEAEGKAAGLPLGTQAAFLEAAAKLTFPGGFGPFAEMMQRAAALAGVEFGQGPDTISPQPSPPANQTASETHGT